MRDHGPWKIHETREVYRDPWLQLTRDEVTRPDGQPGSHCIVRLKNGVSVLALDAAGDVHLTEEFHYAVGRETLEVVSGGVESGEDALGSAQRELAEELGIEAGRWRELGVVDPFTAVVLSPTRLYLAQDLRFGPPACEGTEQIRHRQMPLAEAVEAVWDGRITHAPSCVLILKTHILAEQGRLGS